MHEVFDTVNPSLADLPIPTCWPLDGGPYITFPLVLTHDPLTGKRNVGLYRLQKFDDRTLGMHWQRHKGGAEHWRRSKEERRRMEVAVAIGVDPTLMYSPARRCRRMSTRWCLRASCGARRWKRCRRRR